MALRRRGNNRNRQHPPPARSVRDHAGSAVARVEHGPRTGTTQIPDANLYTPPPSRIRTQGMVNRRLGMCTTPPQTQMLVPTGIGLPLLRLPLPPGLLQPSLELAYSQSTTAPESARRPSTRPKSWTRTFSKTPNSSYRAYLLSQHSSLAKERHQARSGKAGDNWVISRSGRFTSFIPREEPHPHPRVGSCASNVGGGYRPRQRLRTRTTWWTLKAEIQVGTHATAEQKCDQLAG